jgi:hypothetical protein
LVLHQLYVCSTTHSIYIYYVLRTGTAQVPYRHRTPFAVLRIIRYVYTSHNITCHYINPRLGSNVEHPTLPFTPAKKARHEAGHLLRGSLIRPNNRCARGDVVVLLCFSRKGLFKYIFRCFPRWALIALLLHLAPFLIRRRYAHGEVFRRHLGAARQTRGPFVSGNVSPASAGGSTSFHGRHHGAC